MAKQKAHAWQEKMRKAGKGPLTVFLDMTLIKKIKSRAKGKTLSAADYLNNLLTKLYKAQDDFAKSRSKPEKIEK